MVEKNKEESKYSRSELINNSQALFNVSPEVVVGALYNNSAHALCISEVKEAINTFLKRKVN